MTTLVLIWRETQEFLKILPLWWAETITFDKNRETNGPNRVKTRDFSGFLFLCSRKFPCFYQVEPLWGWWRLWPEYSFLARDVISSMNSGVVYELSVFCLEHWENDIFGSWSQLSIFRNLIFWETLPHYISWKLVKMDPQMDLQTTFLFKENIW